MSIKSLEIEGLNIIQLKKIDDTRGCLTEIFRDDWFDNDSPVQWNFVKSHPNTLRGFHLHSTHTDFLFLAEGKMRLGVKDLRPGSSTYGLSRLIELSGGNQQIVCIKPGIGHGFYFPTESTLIYGLSHYWHLPDEHGCMWDAPELGIDWGVTNMPPLLSERDANADSFETMISDFNRKWKK